MGALRYRNGRRHNLDAGTGQEYALTRLHEVTQEAKAAGMSKKDLRAVISATFKADSVRYGDVPKGVTGLVKGWPKPAAKGILSSQYPLIPVQAIPSSLQVPSRARQRARPWPVELGLWQVAQR